MKSWQNHFFFSRRFLPLFITQFLGAFNDNAFKNAFLIWFTYDAAKNSTFDTHTIVTLSAGLFILPFIFFSPMAGQLSDKYEKTYIAQTIKGIEFFLMISASIAFYFENVIGSLIILFCMGMHSTFFGPIKYSLLPEHLKDVELIRGNAYIEGGTFLSILLGTIFGGLIIRTTHGAAIFSVAVILFAFLGWLASRMIPKTPINDPQLKISWNVFSETWKILGYARENKTVWLSIIGISWLWLIGIAFLTQFPVYTKEILGANELIVTLLLTVFSIGIGVGSVLCNYLLKGKITGRLVPLGTAGMTISSVLFVGMTMLYVHRQGVHPLPDYEMGIIQFLRQSWTSTGILVSLFLLAGFCGIYAVPLYAIMQHKSKEKFISRIIASNNVLNGVFMVVVSLISIGLFTLNFTVTDILLLVGLANIPIYFIIRGVAKE